MSEQREPVEFLFRCERCARRWGYAPVLAVAERKAGSGGWRLWAAHRGGRRNRPITVREGGAPHGRSVQDIAESGPGAGYSRSKRLQLHLLTADAVQLACTDRRCPHRPRRRQSELVEEAKQGIAGGRREGYV